MVFAGLGIDPPRVERIVSAVVRIENILSNYTMSRKEMKEDDSGYTKMSIDEVCGLTRFLFPFLANPIPSAPKRVPDCQLAHLLQVHGRSP